MEELKSFYDENLVKPRLDDYSLEEQRDMIQTVNDNINAFAGKMRKIRSEKENNRNIPQSKKCREFIR